MDSLTFFVYLIEVILPRDLFPDFTSSQLWLAILICFLSTLGALVFSKTREEFKDYFQRYVRKILKTTLWFFGIWAFLHFLTGFVPDREGAYKIAAAYGVQSVYQAVTESEEAKRIASKSIQVLESSLDKYLTKEEPVEEEASAE